MVLMVSKGPQFLTELQLQDIFNLELNAYLNCGYIFASTIDKTKILGIINIRITGGVVGNGYNSRILVSILMFVQTVFFYIFPVPYGFHPNSSSLPPTSKIHASELGMLIVPQLYVFMCKMPHDGLATIRSVFPPCPQSFRNRFQIH